MARKRGGIAGFYDRNKGFLKKAVPAGLSFIPGVGIPLAAAAGAAFGADTEGRNFFNMSNIPGALRGAAEGYGIGKGTQALAGGVKGLLAPKAAGVGMGGATGAASQAGGYGGVGSMPGVGFGLGGTSATTEPIAGLGRAAADRAFGDLGMSLGDVANAGKTAGKAMGFRQALMQPQVLGSAIQAGIGQLPSAQTAALNAQTELAQKEFEERQRQNRLEEERRQRIAELLMPYAMQNFPQYFGGR